MKPLLLGRWTFSWAPRLRWWWRLYVLPRTWFYVEIYAGPLFIGWRRPWYEEALEEARQRLEAAP